MVCGKMILCIMFVLLFYEIYSKATNYTIGVGIADVTGPAAEINMMGYGRSEQQTSGIHMRLFSRAYIIRDKSKFIVFVSVDIAMISQIIKTSVSKRISELYNGIYDVKNIALSATHTHSGPGGYHQYVLFSLTSLGFIKQSFDAIVDGIVLSIHRAHKNLQQGTLSVIKGNLEGSTINRSPTSYLENSLDERKKYDSNVDTSVTMLRFDSVKGDKLGVIVWFAVHPTSKNYTNVLISGDNKGYASQMFERLINGRDSLPGKGPFVAAFAQSNGGDVSPNTRGAFCQDTGKRCDALKNSCNNQPTLCVASGPGRDMFESAQIIGGSEFNNARKLYNSADHLWTHLSGPVNFIHQFVDMSNATVYINVTTSTRTCKAAKGSSFAAGTTDGPGTFEFKQGNFWSSVLNMTSKPLQVDVTCQAPKSILINTGRMKDPYEWTPEIVETQLLRVGQMVIVPVPGELTTMAGRRLRESVLTALKDVKFAVIAGLSNVYADYVVTFEEYQAQRYEAASTLFGPNTLLAYQQQYVRLAQAMSTGEKLSDGLEPPYNVEKLLTFHTGDIFDLPSLERNFGDLLVAPNDTYIQGDLVQVRFVSAHPRNNLRLEGTFMRVEQYLEIDNRWVVRFTDANFETKFLWLRTNLELGWSEAELSWSIPLDQTPGIYRIVHEGTRKQNFTGLFFNFTGQTKSFRVILRSNSTTLQSDISTFNGSAPQSHSSIVQTASSVVALKSTQSELGSTTTEKARFQHLDVPPLLNQPVPFVSTTKEKARFQHLDVLPLLNQPVPVGSNTKEKATFQHLDVQPLLNQPVPVGSTEKVTSASSLISPQSHSSTEATSVVTLKSTQSELGSSITEKVTSASPLISASSSLQSKISTFESSTPLSHSSIVATSVVTLKSTQSELGSSTTEKVTSASPLISASSSLKSEISTFESSTPQSHSSTVQTERSFVTFNSTQSELVSTTTEKVSSASPLISASFAPQSHSSAVQRTGSSFTLKSAKSERGSTRTQRAFSASIFTTTNSRDEMVTDDLPKRFNEDWIFLTTFFIYLVFALNWFSFYSIFG